MRQGLCRSIFCGAIVIASAAWADAGNAFDPSQPQGVFAAAATTDAELADNAPAASPDQPIKADDYDPFLETPAQPGVSQEQYNNGGTHFGVDFAYANNYVYRGVAHDNVTNSADTLNLLFDGTMSFDFGKYPHPYVGVFADIYDADPVSRFQEFRPYVGANWDLRPFDWDISAISYIYPERETFNIPEVDFRLTLDDQLLFNTDDPVISPYVLGAFTYQKNEGWYVETGIKHDFVIEGLGLTFTPQACVAWISGLHQQFVFINTVKSTGWQHYEVGLSVSYSLNHLLDVSTRFGEFDVLAFGFYDHALSPQITADTVTWGGIGMAFKY